MNEEPLFTGEDLRLIEALVYDPNLTPSYESIKGCLVWPDEITMGLTSEGRSHLDDLLAARGFLHQGKKLSDYSIAPEYFPSIWERAQKQGLKWPGFNRLVLSEADLEYYRRRMREEAEAGMI